MKKVIEVEQALPARLPFKCPVCNGYGQLGRHPNVKLCHGCDGNGWVIVDQYEQEVIADGTNIL